MLAIGLSLFFSFSWLAVAERVGLCAVGRATHQRFLCFTHPQRLWRELRAEAPHYAKLIPELPRLLHDALRQRPADQQQALRELLEVQHRTNRLLQSIIYGGVGFVLGLLAMQLFVRMRIF